MFAIFLYSAAAISLCASFCKDRKKTRASLIKAGKAFINILPSMLSILLLIGILLSVFDEEMISTLLGSKSGVKGMIIAGAAGCITLIPGFVAFPLAASLIGAGAGYAQIALFICTLMMVGIAIFPLESKYFGKRISLKRNLLSLAVSVAASCIIGVII